MMSETYEHVQPAAQLPRLAAMPVRTERFALSPTLFTGLARVVEFALIAATGYLIASAYVAEADFSATWYYVLAPVLTALSAVAIFQAMRLYDVPALTAAAKHWPRIVIGWALALGMFVSVVFFMKAGADFSRVWVASWFAAGLAGALGGRMLMQSIALKAIAAGRFARRAVVYGSGEHAARLLKALEADAASDVRICGMFDDRIDQRVPTNVLGYPVLGNREDLITFCRHNNVDMVLIALPLAAEERVNELMRHIHVLPADIRIAATTSQLKLSPKAYSYVGHVPMLDLSHKPISDWGLISKAAFDKIIAALAILFLSPLMAAVALAIKLESRGPILFRQKRYGFNNEMIEVLKFRSMFTERCDAGAAKLVTKDDPRVTRVGRIIRKSSLDELPQLWNVLRGELSLVGPRPHAVQAKAADKLYPDVVDGYFARHKVKPGITGWAQINGWRGETDTPEKIQMRVAHDLYYIENWSLWLDASILLRTPTSLLASRDNAY
jgi:Undecaprenyl-phosphate glucose phosphotransferase